MARYRLKKDTVRAKDREDGPGPLRPAGASMTSNSRVQKFRTIEDMNAAQERARPGADFEQFLRHCARWWLLSPRQYPRGVFKFRTIEDAQRARSQH